MENVAIDARKEIGARLRSARKAAGKTQKEVAAIVGKTAQAISSWERGATSPSIPDMTKLADFLGVRFEWLAHGRGEREGGPTPTPVPTGSFTGMDNTTSSRVIEFLMARLEDVEAQLAEVKNAQRLSRERRMRNGQKAIPTTGTEHGS